MGIGQGLSEISGDANATAHLRHRPARREAPAGYAAGVTFCAPVNGASGFRVGFPDGLVGRPVQCFPCDTGGHEGGLGWAEGFPGVPGEGQGPGMQIVPGAPRPADPVADGLKLGFR